MAEIYLDPAEFQKQIDSFETCAESIKELKYSLDKRGVRLQSIDKYAECVEKFNETIALFSQLLTQDTDSMKLIKAKWMNVDGEIATKKFGDIIKGK